MASNITWKDKTFSQVLTSINNNKNGTIISRRNMHNAPPLKIYRKEISILTVPSKSSRLNVSISSIDTPNGYTNSVSIPINASTTTLHLLVQLIVHYFGSIDTISIILFINSNCFLSSRQSFCNFI